jgi:hypothetical protein
MIEGRRRRSGAASGRDALPRDQAERQVGPTKFMVKPFVSSRLRRRSYAPEGFTPPFELLAHNPRLS